MSKISIGKLNSKLSPKLYKDIAQILVPKKMDKI